MNGFVLREIGETIETFQRMQADSSTVAAISHMGEICAKALHAGKKIMLAGNGGSAADAQHIAAEFVSRLSIAREPLVAVALTTDTSILTAIGNDYGFEQIFARQLCALGNADDVLIAISTSGRSPNILRALQTAREKKIIALGLTGSAGGEMVNQCHCVVQVPSARTQNIQEAHIMIGHTICAIAEQGFLSPSKQADVLSRGLA